MSLRRWLLKLYLARFGAPRDLLRHAFRRYPERTALIAASGELTFAALGRRVQSLAAGLESTGLRPGDSLFALLPDDWQQVEVRLAAFEANFVLTSFHTSHDPNLIARAAGAASPRAFVYDPALAGRLPDDLAAAVPGLRLIPVGPDSPYERLIADTPARPSAAPVRPSDPAGLGFTSGTTGAPKGLYTTHGAIVTSLKLTAANVSVSPGRRDVFLLGIPLVGAGGGVVLPMLFSGAALVVPEHYDADELVSLITRHGVTRLFVTPSTLIDLLDHPSADLGGLWNVIYGTAPMPVPKLKEAIRRWGPVFQQGYGMAEVLPPVSLLQMGDHGSQDQPAPDAVLRSAGSVVPEVGVRIVDGAGQPRPEGSVGEIAIHSPTTFSGYWGQPELTARALAGGWYRSGDLGFLAAGRLTVLCRRADLLQRAGRQLAPLTVEEPAHRHPGVKEACLVDGRGAGEITLVVSPRRSWRGAEARLTAELKALLADRLDAWQRPDRIEVWPELPRSYLVKVLRRQVRQELARRTIMPREKEA